MILASKAARAARRLLLASSVLAAGSLAVSVAAETVADEAATRFGARESVMDISLSPSGDKIAFISPGPDHTEILSIIDLAGDAEVFKLFAQTDITTDLDWCSWADEAHIVCQASAMVEAPGGAILLPIDRLFVVDTFKGGGIRELSRRASGNALGFAQSGGSLLALDVGGEQGEVLMSTELVGEFSTGTRLANTQEGLGAELVNVVTARRRQVEKADEAAVRYVADETGKLRLKVRAPADLSGTLTGRFEYLYRPAQGGVWRSFGDLSIDGTPIGGFAPVAADLGRNSAYGFVTKDGYDALATFPLDGTGAGKVLLARNDVDVDGLIRIGRQRRTVGATYATEKREIEYFDPELKKLAAGLAKALPDQPLINIVGASTDEGKLLLVAASDTQPGQVYLYDKAARALEPLLAVRGNLDGVVMGKMRPVSYPSADGTMIPAYLTLPPGSDGKNLPAIVMPHGGPSARDEWGFDWLVQYFIAKGYAVLQPNYRGSAGYGENWYGKNGFKAWETAIGDVNDAGRWLVSQGIAKPDKLAIVGWSYGGYAALQSQVLDPTLFKAVAAIAPVTDLGYLTADAQAYTNSRLVREFVGTGPHIEAGSPRRQAARFAAPVALFHGTRDLNVTVRHSQDMAKALQAAGKSVMYREYKDLQHGLDDSTVRASMLADIGKFLETSMESK